MGDEEKKAGAEFGLEGTARDYFRSNVLFCQMEMESSLRVKVRIMPFKPKRLVSIGGVLATDFEGDY